MRVKRASCTSRPYVLGMPSCQMGTSSASRPFILRAMQHAPRHELRARRLRWVNGTCASHLATSSGLDDSAGSVARAHSDRAASSHDSAGSSIARSVQRFRGHYMPVRHASLAAYCALRKTLIIIAYTYMLGRAGGYIDVRC